MLEGGQFSIKHGRANFTAHGDVSTAPVARFREVVDLPRKLLALGNCKRHG